MRYTALAGVMLVSGLCAGFSHPATAKQNETIIPFAPGVTIVFAVRAGTHYDPASTMAQGDYEMIVAIVQADENGVSTMAKVDAFDGGNRPLHLNIPRHVPAHDLARAREQVLGFQTEDPLELSGTTSLGPSREIVRQLRTAGSAGYMIRNYGSWKPSIGTLTRVSAAVPFPVLINGRRTELPAMRVQGKLRYGDKVRPWEQYILDHPQHPLTLRVTYGAPGADFDFKPEFVREIVRIDFPVEQARTIEQTLTTECRVELPGIYFDFDRATLKEESNQTLETVAGILARHPDWRVSIEGHTDNIGTDAYNMDLSSRRAAAVKTALVEQFGTSAARLTTAGYGWHRPVESNETLAGRARNRRVELVRDCSGQQN